MSWQEWIKTAERAIARNVPDHLRDNAYMAYRAGVSPISWVIAIKQGV